MARDYQIKENQGGSPDSIIAEKYGAGEYNSLSEETENAVSRAGLDLAPADGTGEDTTQLAQTLLINGAGATSFQAGGVANAITLIPVTGSGGLKLPPDYSTLDGMRINFVVGATNTGAVTVSIGQTTGAEFGAKKLLTTAEAELGADTLVAGTRVEIFYSAALEGGAGAFQLSPWSALSADAGTTLLTTQLGANVIIATATVGSLSSYDDGTLYTLQVLNPNTGPTVTLNVDGLGAKQIYRDYNTGLAVGQFVVGASIVVLYNAALDAFQWVNENLEERNLTVSLGETTGTNDLVATTVPPQAALVDQRLYVFEATVTNTGAVTIDIDGLGLRDIQTAEDTALVAGSLVENSTYLLAYNQTHDDFHLVSASAASLGAGFVVLNAVNAGFIELSSYLQAGGLRSYSNTNTAGSGDTDISFGRTNLQYVSFHGGSTGNFASSVSQGSNPKPFIIRASDDNAATYGITVVFNPASGALEVDGDITADNLGDLASQNTINNSDWSGTDLAIGNGGTGSSTASGARTNLGLGALAVQNTINNSDWLGTDLAIGNGGTNASTTAGARQSLEVNEASNSEVWASTNATKVVTANRTRTALVPVSLGSGSGSFTPNLNNGRVFTRTLTGNSTVANPSGNNAGEIFQLVITQDGGGANSLAWGSEYEFTGGSAPTVSQAGGATDRYTCQIISGSVILVTYTQNFS